MKKIFILLILFLAIFISGCVNKEAEIKSVSQQGNGQVVFSEVVQDEMSDLRDGVEITIDNIKKENGQTVIEITLSNHRYDLSSFDIESLSSFAGIAPIEYLVQASTMGGHHIEIKMTFNEELSGNLIVGLNDSLSFNFDI